VRAVQHASKRNEQKLTHFAEKTILIHASSSFFFLHRSVLEKDQWKQWIWNVITWSECLYIPGNNRRPSPSNCLNELLMKSQNEQSFIQASLWGNSAATWAENQHELKERGLFVHAELFLDASSRSFLNDDASCQAFWISNCCIHVVSDWSLSCQWPLKKSDYSLCPLKKLPSDLWRYPTDTQTTWSGHCNPLLGKRHWNSEKINPERCHGGLWPDFLSSLSWLAILCQNPVMTREIPCKPRHMQPIIGDYQQDLFAWESIKEFKHERQKSRDHSLWLHFYSSFVSSCECWVDIPRWSEKMKWLNNVDVIEITHCFFKATVGKHLSKYLIILHLSR
jgi:hypothetical protein